MSLNFNLMNNEARVGIARGVCFSRFDCKPISVCHPLPVPGSLAGQNMHHTVRTDEHRAWRQQLLQVNQGNIFLSVLFLLSFNNSHLLFSQLGTVITYVLLEELLPVWHSYLCVFHGYQITY